MFRCRRVDVARCGRLGRAGCGTWCRFFLFAPGDKGAVGHSQGLVLEDGRLRIGGQFCNFRCRLRPDDGDERLQDGGEPVFSALGILYGQVESVVAVELDVAEHLFHPGPPHGVLAPVFGGGARRVHRVELDEDVLERVASVQGLAQHFCADEDLFEPGPFAQGEHSLVLGVFLVVHLEVGDVLHERHEQCRIYAVRDGCFHDGQAGKLFGGPGSAQVDDLQQVVAALARERYQVALAERAPESLDDSDAAVLELLVAHERYSEGVLELFEVRRCRALDFLVVYSQDGGEDVHQFRRGAFFKAVVAEHEVPLVQEVGDLAERIFQEHRLFVDGFFRGGRNKDSRHR